LPLLRRLRLHLLLSAKLEFKLIRFSLLLEHLYELPRLELLTNDDHPLLVESKIWTLSSESWGRRGES